MSQSNSNTMWTAVIVIIVVSVIGMFFLAGGGSNTSIDDISINNDEIDLSQEWVKGNPEAEHIIVEYSDFQCPACAGRAPMLSTIMKEFKNDVAFVYRHFPLPQHEHAFITGQAAEAAGQEGKFFEMHDIIFDNQAAWQSMSVSQVEELMLDYAEQIGISDMEAFEKYMNSSEARDAVETDYIGGVALGINSTPTVFFNGEVVPNSYNYDAFRAAIRSAIQGDN